LTNADVSEVCRIIRSICPYYYTCILRIYWTQIHYNINVLVACCRTSVIVVGACVYVYVFVCVCARAFDGAMAFRWGVHLRRLVYRQWVWKKGRTPAASRANNNYNSSRAAVSDRKATTATVVASTTRWSTRCPAYCTSYSTSGPTLSWSELIGRSTEPSCRWALIIVVIRIGRVAKLLVTTSPLLKNSKFRPLLIICKSSTTYIDCLISYIYILSKVIRR